MIKESKQFSLDRKPGTSCPSSVQVDERQLEADESRTTRPAYLVLNANHLHQFCFLQMNEYINKLLENNTYQQHQHSFTPSVL